MRYPIKELITEKISGEWGNEPVDGEGNKVIRTTNFTNYGIIDYEKIVVRDIDKQKVDKKHLKNGDIIIEKSGGSPAQPVGRVVFFDLETDEKFLCNNFTTILRPNKNLVVPKYFLYQLHIAYQRGKTRRYQNKTTGIINLQLDKYLETKIEVPSLPDQLHIANILSKAENLIAQRKESIRLLDEFLKSTFLEMFGDCTKNEKNWEKVELKHFGEIITGNTPPRNNAENYSSNFLEWIKTDNIPADDTYITNAVEYLSESALKYARTVESGALLVACIAGSIHSVGRAALTDRRVSFNQQINAIQPNSEIEPLYLYWLFKISRKYIQDAASNGMKKILTKGGFEKIKVIKPPVELQTQFAQIVEKTEVIKTQYQQSLQELENLYGSLSQKAFRGEITVKEESLLIAAEPNVEYKML